MIREIHQAGSQHPGGAGTHSVQTGGCDPTASGLVWRPQALLLCEDMSVSSNPKAVSQFMASLHLTADILVPYSLNWTTQQASKRLLAALLAPCPPALPHGAT